MKLFGIRKLGVLEISMAVIVIGGAALLYWSLVLEEDNEDHGAPERTEFIGDYSILDNDDPIVVRNRDAGFELVAPAEWDVYEEGGAGGEVYVNMLSPEVEITEEDISMGGGCAIRMNAFFQNVRVNNLNAEIEYLRDNPSEGFSNMPDNEVVNIDGKYSLLSSYKAPEDPAMYSQVGRNVVLEIPFSDKGVLEMLMRVMPENEDRCLQDFDEMVSSIEFTDS